MRKYHYFLLASLLALAASCTRLSLRVELPDGVTVNGELISSVICVDSPVCLDASSGGSFEDNPQTKSSFTDPYKLSCLTLVFYEKGKSGSPAMVRHYDVAGQDKVTFGLPDNSKTYTIYALANFFDSEAAAKAVFMPSWGDFSESDMENWEHTFDSYKDFRNWGFPMAKKLENYSMSNIQKISVKVMVAKVELQIEDIPESAEFTNFSMRLVHSAKTCRPFKEGYAARNRDVDVENERNRLDDILTPEDIETLRTGGVVTLYLLENMQGELTPGNTVISKKEPREVALEKRDLFTFYEISSDITVDKVLSYEGVRFRFALGKNTTTNFDIPRNYVLKLHVKFRDIIYNTGWYVESDDPTFKGRFFFDKTDIGVVGDITDQIFVMPDYDNYELGYRIDSDEAAAAGLQITGPVEDSWQGRKGYRFTFKTTKKLNGFYTFGQTPEPLPVHITIYDANPKHCFNGKPMLQKELVVNVYDKVFPLYFYTDNGYQSMSDQSGTATLKAYAENPLKLPLSFETSVNYGFGMQQDTPQVTREANGNNWRSDLHSYVEYARYDEVSTSLGFPVRNSRDNTVGRSGKAIHQWNVKKKYDGASGYDGVRIDIRIAPIRNQDIYRPAGAIVSSPAFADDAVFYNGHDIHKEDIRLTLNENDSYFIGKLPAIWKSGIDNGYMNDLAVDESGATYTHQNSTGDPQTHLGVKVTSVAQHPGSNVRYGFAYPSGSYGMKSDLDHIPYKFQATRQTAFMDTWQHEDPDRFRSCPFYVINGGMVIDGFVYREDWDRPGDKSYYDTAGRRGYFAVYREPGRDIGMFDYTYDGPKYQNVMWFDLGGYICALSHQSGAFVGADELKPKNPIFMGHVMMDPPISDRGGKSIEKKVSTNLPCFGIWTAVYKDGLIHRDATIWQGHNYSIRMTVNGMTNWPGATNDEYGGFRYFDRY